MVFHLVSPELDLIMCIEATPKLPARPKMQMLTTPCPVFFQWISILTCKAQQVRVGASWTKLVAVGSYSEMDVLAQHSFQIWGGGVTSPCTSASPVSKSLHEFAFSLGMCLLFTKWPHSLPWVKPSRLFGQLAAHFYGSSAVLVQNMTVF